MVKIRRNYTVGRGNNEENMGVGYKFTCSDCDYSDVVSPDQFYLIKADGSIEICDDHNHDRIFDFFREQNAWKKLNSLAEKAMFEEKNSGYGASYLCKSCLHGWLEIQTKDKPKCPKCSSVDTVDKWYLRDAPCPTCKTGKITAAQDPDWVS